MKLFAKDKEKSSRYACRKGFMGRTDMNLLELKQKLLKENLIINIMAMCFHCFAILVTKINWDVW